MAFSLSHEDSVGGRLPRGVRVRRAGQGDELAAFEVMQRAMGFEVAWSHHAGARHHLRAAPHSSYWVAEETPRFGRNRVVGYAHSMVRDGVWHLTEFFVLPTHHRQGIGGALLAHSLEDGDRAGAHTRFVLASQHPSANSLYIRKAGCFPRLPMFLLSGPILALHPLGFHNTPILDVTIPSDALRAGLPPLSANREGPRLRAEPIRLTRAVQAALDALDREGIGFARPPEHEHWTHEMGGPRGASRLFLRDDEIVGYAYYGRSASGPVLASDPNDLPRMITHVTSVARCIHQPTPELGFHEALEPYWAVPGSNEIMLRWLLQCGWQIAFQYLFMSSRPLGQMERYVCHNPLHFL